MKQDNPLNLDLIKESVDEVYGPRCPDYLEGCFACEAWIEMDRIEATEKQLHEAKLRAERLFDVLAAIETMTATGDGLSPEECIEIHVMAMRAVNQDVAK